MKSLDRFADLPEEERDWIDGYLNGTISPEEFELLQNRMEKSSPLRTVMRRYLNIQNHLELESGETEDSAVSTWRKTESQRRNLPRISWLLVGTVAALAFFLGVAAVNWRGDREVVSSEEDEPSASGFGVVGRLSGVVWGDAIERQSGDILDEGEFTIELGTAEIQFFSGALMLVEGPARIELRSAWEAVCSEGSVRMKVPPAARGFVLHGPATRIVDLGTEFGLEVRDGKADVEVFDGEVVFQHQEGEEQLVTAGGAWHLPDQGDAVPANSGRLAFPDLSLDSVRDGKENNFQKWVEYRDTFRDDDRIIAYHTFESALFKGNSVLDFSSNHHDGAVIIAEPVPGRWREHNSSLDFRRPGSRVRVNIPGEFSAFTFACWVRIDSLDRWYSSLFMGDGYETGEPHWQIRNDGKMMLSIMIDDSRPSVYKNDAAGFHRVYFSPPMWDMTKSGQWMHLCSVFDPQQREVLHYVDGEEISREAIKDEHHIDTLRIGNAEIGSWGQPFRKTPKFAIRNLNGRIDEMMVFRNRLSEEEIRLIYEKGRP